MLLQTPEAEQIQQEDCEYSDASASASAAGRGLQQQDVDFPSMAAAMFKSLGSKIKTSVGGLLSQAETAAVDKIFAKYPDINEVVDLLNEMKSTYKEAADEDGDGEPDSANPDGKWRPLLLTLGVLYKLQRIRDSNGSSWYNRDDIFVHDDEEEKRLLETFGYYWHFSVKVAEALRSINNPEGQDGESGPPSMTENFSEDEDGNLIEREEIYENVVNSTGVSRENILFAHATDSYHVTDHCPDFAVVLIHELNQILVIICGTRMMPTPKMKDVFMDLHADAEPFLRGVAHRGMAAGALNILSKITPKVVEVLEANPGYNVMVIGYSLGAGICQLAVMEMLQADSLVPDGTEIRCINFGSPPIYKSNQSGDGDCRCPNIFSVVYNNDGLCSASAASVTRLFMQIREVNRLQMRRRDMMQLLFRSIPAKDGSELKDSDDEDDDDFATKTGSRKEITALIDDDEWRRIAEAVDKVDDQLDNEELACLGHPARQLYMFKRNKEGEVITRRFSDTIPLTRHLRLRGAMFSHHMPWGYDAMFTGYGADASAVDLNTLEVPKKGEGDDWE